MRGVTGPWGRWQPYVAPLAVEFSEGPPDPEPEPEPEPSPRAVVAGGGGRPQRKPILIERQDDSWDAIKAAVKDAETTAIKAFAKRVRRRGKALKDVAEVMGRIEALAAHAPTESDIRLLRERVSETLSWMARQRKLTYQRMLAELEAKEERAREDEEDEWLIML